MPFPLRAAAAAAALLCAGLAQADHTEPPVRSLGVVTIRGGAPSSLPTHIPSTTEGLLAAQIAQQVNATDAEDALKYLPSLLVRKRYPGDYNHAVLSTRASGTGNSARSMVFADSLLLSNYLGNGATFAPRWGLVQPEEIERVDVLYGPFSAAYPGNAVGAVVDYVTRMPEQFEAHVKLGLHRQPQRLYGTDETFGGHRAAASLGSKAGDWRWWLSVSRSDSDGQPQTFPTRLVAATTPGSAGTPVTGAVPGHNPRGQDWLILGTATQYRTVQEQAKLKLAYDVSPSVRASYTLGTWHNTSEGRPDSYLRNAAGQPVFSGMVNTGGRSFLLAPTDFNQSNEKLAHRVHGLTVRQRTGGVFDWEVAASRYDYRTDELRAPTTALPAAANGGAGRIVDGRGTGWTTFAAKGIWRPDAAGQDAALPGRSAHEIEAGLQRDTYTLLTQENATADWISGAPAARTSSFGGETLLTSLWVQDSWRIAADWRAVLGLRLERWQARDGATSSASATARHAGRSETHSSPKAAIAWQAAPDWTLKLATGRAVRMPTVGELYQGGVGANGTLTNNDPDLQPERSWTTEFSAERMLGTHGSTRLTAFHERTQGALTSQTNTTVTPNVTNVQNVERVETQGLEAALQATDWLAKGIDIAGSLTFADSRIEANRRNPASLGKWQPRVPRWRATALATWRPSFDGSAAWALTAAVRHSGRQYTALDNGDFNDNAYTAASRYTLVDLRARWQIDPQWSAAVGIDNLTNRQVWNFHPYPQRTVHAELNWRH